MTLLYFSCLAFACGVWLAVAAVAPPFTRWFWAYVVWTAAAEAYLCASASLRENQARCRASAPDSKTSTRCRPTVADNKKNTRCRPSVADSIVRLYPVVKISQRLVAVGTIFALANGDLGSVIAVDLAVVGCVAVGIMAVRQLRSLRPRSVWGLLSRLDEGLAGFLWVAIGVLLWQYDWSVFAQSRVQLLLGFTVHYTLVVARESLELKPGCRLDRWNAIALVGGWTVIGLIS